MKTFLLAIVAGFGTVMSIIFGNYDTMAQVVVIMLAADWITGFTAAAINHELSSWKGFVGLLKKLLILFTLYLINRIDAALGAAGNLLLFAKWFYIGNEGISIIENLGRAGVKLPTFLSKLFEQLHKKGDAGE